jgi:ubiquinone/menaquinone biosynthesis C-methylase UbiE
MSADADHPVEIQRQYYTETAARYDQMHAQEGDDDPVNAGFLHALLRLVEAHTILDVGAGTGRGVRRLAEAFPNALVCGVEPVAALAERAVKENRVPAGAMFRGTGEALPFADASFDAVCEFSILHHVRNPSAVVREMLRVARKAVFIADSNRFGQGSGPARLFKLALYKTGLWGVANYVKTRGKGYLITEGDGLAYSYSVFDSFSHIANWADRVILIPSRKEKATSWLHPLLNSSGVLVCAIREDYRITS